jgi:hypothetical protein
MLEFIREWLISQGYPAEELDTVEEPQVLADIGNALVSLMLNTNNIGTALVQMSAEISKLKKELEAIKNA